MPRIYDPARSCLPVRDWPAADQILWADALGDGDDETRTCAAKWRPTTAQTNREGYGRWVNHLTRTGVDLQTAAAERVTPAQVRLYAGELRGQDLAPQSVCNRISQLFCVMSVLAPDQEWGWLQRRANRLALIAEDQHEPKPLTMLTGDILDKALKALKQVERDGLKPGLLPAIEDGDLDYRASSLTWFNDKMPDVIHLVPITARDGKDGQYSFARYLQARRIGTEDSIQKATPELRESIIGLRQQGWITMDAFEAAVKATKRKAFEAIYAPFDEAFEQFKALEKAVDEKFANASPGLTTAKEAFEEMRRLMAPILKKKREEEPDTVAGEPAADANSAGTAKSMTGFWTAGMPSDQSGSWQQAEALVQSGNIDQGLQQMASLAAQETSGRARFLRKLMLVDVCRSAGRERLARTVLEELNQQILDYKLEQWESSALVGAVWSRLYRFYKISEASSEQDQARALYNQLCRLDPWQAYIDCED